MSITFIRHGSTDANNGGILQGQTVDSKLNYEGKGQIKDAIRDLKKFNFNLIFSSPSSRASQSAKIVKEGLSIPMEFDKRIMERDYGSLGGKNWKDASKKMNMNEEDFLSMQRSEAYNFQEYNGESSDDVQARVKEFINDIKEKYRNKKILVVTHGGVIRQMHNLYKEGPYSKHERIPNASIHVFDI